MYSRYLLRYKNAVATYSSLAGLVDELHERFETWKVQPNHQSNETSTEEEVWRSRITPFIEKSINRLLTLIGRSHVIQRSEESHQPRRVGAVTVDHLRLMYVGPGTEHPNGPRHDNDHIDINDISIAPTHNELTCTEPPYLPYNVPGAPHSYPSNSMQRLLDIHFRLLREELMSVIRFQLFTF